MAFPDQHFSNKGSLIIACFCLQFLLHSCSEFNRIEKLEWGLYLFHTLEGQVDRLKCVVDFHPSYVSLTQRIREFELSKRQSAESIKVLHWLGPALLIRDNNLKYPYESNLIGNITDHLSSVKKDLDTLLESSNTNIKLEVINKYKQQYKLSIQDKLRESNYLIEKFIRPNLEMMEHDLKNELRYLKGLSIREKVEKEKMLEKLLVQRELLTSFKLVGHVMSFLSGSGVSAVWHIGRGSYERRSSCYYTGTRNYMNITSEMNILEKKIRSILQQKIKHFIKVLDGCYNVAILFPEIFVDVLQKVREIKQKLSKKKLGFKDVRNLEDEFRENINTNILTLEAEDSHESNQDVEFIIKQMIIPTLKESVVLGTSIPKILQNFNLGNNPSSLRLKEFLYQNKENLTIMKSYEDGIQDMVDKVVSNIKRDIFRKDFNERREYESATCSPMVELWEVQRFLMETKKNLSEITYLFEAEGEFLNFLEGFKETMTALVEVYDHIQNYLEQKQLASDIENIRSSNFDSNTSINNNTQFPFAVTELELVIRSNIVLQRYRTAIDAFKRFVFPFASLYLQDLTPINFRRIRPYYLEYRRPNDRQYLTSINLYNGGAVAEAVSQIEILQSRIKLYEQSVRNPDNYIAKKEFTSANNSSRPFYVWKNDNHRSAIRDLLSGKEVLLKADISRSPNRMDAIKFEIIGLEFKTRNRSLQSNFTECFKNFRLRGVHLGNSHYRYDSKVYLISTKSREFDFPFEMKGMTGEMMLSPYASWRFTLVNMTDDADFEELSKYVEEIDLELVGNGFYVTWNVIHNYGDYKFNDLNVEKYYSPVDEKRNNLC